MALEIGLEVLCLHVLSSSFFFLASPPYLFFLCCVHILNIYLNIKDYFLASSSSAAFAQTQHGNEFFL